VFEFSPSDYGSVFARLLETGRQMPLDSGSPVTEMSDELAGLTVSQAFAGNEVANPDYAQACLSGVWLLYDFLDESHTISQKISNPTGSYWHGIMHRREGDYSNSKYWFRRVGEHEVFERLAEEVEQLPHNSVPHWDPFAFVDACEQAMHNSDSSAISACQQIQQLEWQMLFDYSFRFALE